MTAQDYTRAELLLRRDRLVIGSCLLVICLLSWYYLLSGAGTGMSAVAISIRSSSIFFWIISRR